MPLGQKTQVEQQINEWIDAGIVISCSSEYSNPVVVVKRKDGSNRLCVDFRELNNKVVKDRYPVPLIEEQLDNLQKARVFSTLDLKNGFFHVRVNKESQKYLSFVTSNEAMKRLKEVFKCAASADLDINWTKCQFLQRKIEYLGHIIESGQIKASPYKKKPSVAISNRAM